MRAVVNREVELMVFLKPTVTRSPDEVRQLMDDEREKASSIRRWQQELDDEEAARREAEKDE